MSPGSPDRRPRAKGRTDMAELRKCIGSTRFGIEAHEAPVEDFPVQPSQKDGLGRMCKDHWNEYTAGLARDAKARKEASADATTPEPVETKPRRVKAKASEPSAEGSAAARDSTAHRHLRIAEVEPVARTASDQPALGNRSAAIAGGSARRLFVSMGRAGLDERTSRPHRSRHGPAARAVASGSGRCDPHRPARPR
jgi:hypothetical protein